HAGLKVFMVSPGFAARTAEYLTVYRAAAEAGALVAVHAEDHALIAKRTAELHAAGRVGVEWFPQSRPPEAEEIAVRAAVIHAREEARAWGHLRSDPTRRFESRDAPADALFGGRGEGPAHPLAARGGSRGRTRTDRGHVPAQGRACCGLGRGRRGVRSGRPTSRACH